MNSEEGDRNTTQLPPFGGSDLDDTLPPSPVPMDLRLSQQVDDATGPGLSAGRNRSAPPAGLSRATKVVIGLCLVISLLSLVLNAFLISRLLDARQTVTETLDATIKAVNNLIGDGFHYEYHFARMIPVTADIPIDQQMVIPFEGEFPIDTTVQVPIDAGLLGTFQVEVPIDTSVYVSTEVPIHIQQTFHISTTVPISMTIPVDIEADDPAIQGLLNKLQEWLEQLRGSF